jgi:hypothetical protein
MEHFFQTIFGALETIDATHIKDHLIAQKNRYLYDTLLQKLLKSLPFTGTCTKCSMK